MEPHISRRAFLQASCVGLVAASLTGCGKNSLLESLPGYRKPLLDSDLPDFTTPSGATSDLATHLLSRLTYGFRARDYTRMQFPSDDQDYTPTQTRWIERQLNPETLDDSPLDEALRQFDILHEPLAELYEYKDSVLLRELTSATLLRAVYSERQLLELMIQFWSDHFNVASSKGECKWLIASEDRDILRPHALGSFSDLLRAVALGPAMLWYLDGRVNKKRNDKDKANENYARELMELHTLGVHGGYTQSDVMEVARCLTGWTVRDVRQFRKGVVEYHPELHDDGAKVVLGQEIAASLGARDFDRVVEIVALHPSTAQHLAQKLCQRFIADEPPAAVVATVAEAFTESEGNIKATLRCLIHTPEFRASRATKFRRPFEFITAALRATDALTNGGEPVSRYLLRMGHAPFQYPTPDGYPLGESHWTGTLLWRWHFAVALVGNQIPGTTVDFAAFQSRLPSPAHLLPALLGRQPTPLELDAYSQVGPEIGPALLLASPSFQMC